MAESVSIHVLGAGCEVGRSCFVITISDTSILVDAGVHMNPATPEDRLPDIPQSAKLSAIFITHYHLDHIGALPYLTEVDKCHALAECLDIFMTAPTALLAPPVMIDYCKGVTNANMYLPNHVYRLFDKVQYMGLNSPVKLRGNKSFTVTPFYAGHVIGGVGLLIQYRGVSVVYTGDFSVAQDSLLRPIQVPVLSLPSKGVDVVISEATHATTVCCKSISIIEEELCVRIRATLARGGRVLIPIFAVGRTQELAAIIRRRLGSDVILFTTSASGQRASILTTSMMQSWTNLQGDHHCDDLRVSFLSEDKPFPNIPCIVFSSPAMIEGGSSLRLFLQICEDSKNLVVLTGYCNRDTVGNSVILFASRNVRRRDIEIHGRKVKVNCECLYTPFSNHTDSIGIESVLRRLIPRNVVLVHGEKAKMESFKAKLEGLWGTDNVRIDIPQNYAILKYEIKPDTVGNNSSLRIRRRIHATTHDLVDIEELIREKCEGCEIVWETNRALVISTEREEVRLLTNGVDQFTAEYTPRLGQIAAEWAAHNTLFHELNMILSLRVIDDNFSISECSV
jgi:integrator complex subunit 11